MSEGKGDKVDMRAMVRSVTAGAGALALILGSISCGDVARQGRSPVMLVIDALEAAPGTDPTTLGGFLLSDVQTLVEQTVNGVTSRVPTIFNDVGSATLRVVMKDQGTGGIGVSPSELNAVTLTRYRIVYRRADGRNTPGVDVPFPVDGGLSATLGAGGPIEVAFELVRHQAKLEQPLRSMAGFGGRLFISTIAEVTFYGADLAGNDIQATGNISVSFGDYADPE
jgi:hypothetical protein